MTPFPLLIAMLAASIAPCSQKVEGHPHYVIPGALRDVTYHGQLALDAYVPAGEPRPAAIIIHGSQGNKSTHVTQLFEVLDRAGFAWFSIDYRSGDDVAEAIRYVRCPGRFNITPETVLIGEDTGAGIALSLAARGGVRGVVTFGAMLSDVVPSPRKENAGLNGTTAEVLMFHGTSDEESPPAAAEALCNRLPHCTFYPVTGAIHNLENWHPDQWDWKEDLTAWLRGDRRGLWKDIAYNRPAGRELLMDAYIPENIGPLPVVIIIHGGGWEAGNKVTYVSPVFGPLAEAGFAWFSIDYRLTPYVHIPEQLDDVRAAIRYVRAHAARFHIDPHRIALLGESASGQLVAQVASEPCTGCEVQAVVSFYGVYDFTKGTQSSDWQKAAVRRLFGDSSQETLRRYSPLFVARPEQPPVLLIQGTKDELYSGSMEYARKLKEVGAPFKLIVLEGAPHGMENWEGHTEWEFYKHRLVEWLRATLKANNSSE
ncbi:MAG: hypothetical protein DMG84_16930 [Acidobacteria bacterium]|nr:MAG: hypothetical protein DMG84_16930 [Acidobacteriota bacterium]